MPSDTPQNEVRSLFLLYHELRPGGSTYRYVVDTEQFGRQVAMFARRQRELNGLHARVTFDDGNLSDHRFALPILEQYEQKAHFFITAGWTGCRAGYMDWPELRELQAAGHTVGAHGMQHRLLTQCSPAELREELEDARKLLEDGLGAAVRTMSLPGGRGGARVLAACRAAGYAQVFTSAPRAEADPSAAELGRLNLLGDTTLAWMEQLLAPDGRLLRTIERKERLKQAGKQVLGDNLYAQLWRWLNRAEPDGAEGAGA